MTTTLYLIRHGETDWNRTKRWQGHADVPLNERGQQQAQLLAQYMRREGIHFDAIYSSDLTRAYQTAWELGAALRVAVQLLPALREIDVGTWSGLTIEQVREQYPVEVALLDEGQDIPRGGAESLYALSKRVVDTVESLTAQHPNGMLALVMHGGPVRAFLAHAAGQSFSPHHQGPSKHIGNTSMSIVQYDGSGWKIVAANKMAHLESQIAGTDLISAPPDEAASPQSWVPLYLTFVTSTVSDTSWKPGYQQEDH